MLYELLFANAQHLKQKHLLHYARQVGLDLPRYQYEMNDGVFVDVSFGLQRLRDSIDTVVRRS